MCFRFNQLIVYSAMFEHIVALFSIWVLNEWELCSANYFVYIYFLLHEVIDFNYSSQIDQIFPNLERTEWVTELPTSE